MRPSRRIQDNPSCVYFFFDESETKSEQDSNGSALIKRFVSLDFLGLNDIAITNKIKDHLPTTWSEHFYLFKDIQTMKIGSIDSNTYHLQAIKELKDDGTALVWYQRRQLVYMDGYLRSLSCSRKYILFLTDFYRRLLINIDLLVGCNIVHNNIGFKTIVINIGPFIKPILTNFKFGLDIDKGINVRRLFIQYDPTRTQWPIEIHLLCYLQTNKLDSLSFSNIQFVVKNVIDKNMFLKTFGQKIVDEYLEEGVTYFSRYINKNVDWIVSDITVYSKTWDNYALSICYLKIVIDMYNAYMSSKDVNGTKSVKSKFLISFLRLLVGNIHSNPLNRLSVKETTNKFTELMEYCDINDLYLLVCSL